MSPPAGDLIRGRSRFVLNRGARIHYLAVGEEQDGRGIVFLAGAGTDSSIWEAQLSFFSKNHKVLAPDLRGSGESDRPSGRYSAELLASDLEAVVRAEGLEQVTLVGYSMGGLIAQKYVNDHPGEVERLSLLNCTVGGSANPDIVLPAQDVTNTFLFGAALDDADMIEAALDFHFGRDWRDTCPELARRYRPVFERNVASISHQVPILVSPKPLVDDYSSFTMPILCLFARDDVVTPVGNADVASATLPGARVVVVEGHHASMLLFPDVVNELLLELLDTRRADHD